MPPMFPNRSGTAIIAPTVMIMIWTKSEIALARIPPNAVYAMMMATIIAIPISLETPKMDWNTNPAPVYCALMYTV